MTTSLPSRSGGRHITRAELAKHTTTTDCWVLRKGRVYDVTHFADDHPGGADFIHEYAGKDVDAVMRDADMHEHSEGAWEILDDCFIGMLVDDDGNISEAHQDGISAAPAYEAEGKPIVDPTSPLDEQMTSELATARRPLLDLSKPLLWQMLHSTFSKEYYLTQVHIPRHLPEPATIFANPVLEILTRTPWYVVPIVWVPVIVWLAHSSMEVFSPLTWTGLFILGIVKWSFFEYTFHRFLFHVDNFLPDHRYALTLHFLMHGIHHYLPMDRMRLVLPPVFFAIIVQPPLFAYRLFLDWPTVSAMFSGAITGYVIYDLTHYYLHHARVRTSYVRELKKYHLAHHYKQYDAGYGITSKLWDYVFGTVLEYDDAKKAKRN